MIAAIERFLDSLFAPLARELGRMPASAVRGLDGEAGAALLDALDRHGW